MKLNLLISTMNSNINYIAKNLQNIDDKVNIVICHQITTKFNSSLDLHKKVKIIEMFTKGLSRSRNCLINFVNEGICVISDDDVKFHCDFRKNIEEAYNYFPDADIITFQAITPDGGFYKNYSKIPYKHTFLTAAKVSSIEITFYKHSIKDKNISFDTKFGLGTEYSSGEEFIFITDAIKRKLNIYYYPLPISIHPLESSGRIFSKDMFISKGALLYRIFGKKAYVYIILFALKKYSKYKRIFSFKKALTFMYIGLKNYKKVLK